jgi:hypothetical protein
MKHTLVNLGLAILVIFAPIQHMILSALALVICDAILGVMAARKRKEKITSAGFRRTLSKILVYEAAIMIAYIAQHYLIGDTIPVSSVVAGFVGITEFKSCMENLNAVSNGAIIKQLIDKLGSINQQQK